MDICSARKQDSLAHCFLIVHIALRIVITYFAISILMCTITENLEIAK